MAKISISSSSFSVTSERILNKSNRVWTSRTNSQTEKDAVGTGIISGKDNIRNQSIVSLTGSQQTIKTDTASTDYGSSVIINRPNSRRGRRSFTSTIVRGTPSDQETGLTQGYDDDATNITGCVNNDPSNFNPNPPDPPPDPDPDNPPDPPPGSPNDPTPLPSPPPTPNGCAPDDEDQWYNAPGPGSEFCPAGTTYKGFAEIPAGVFRVLCGGPARPPGDGCPEEPVGYSCVSGSCVETPGGTYATIEQCQAADCSESALGYICVSGNCSQVPLSQATYATVEDCQANCSAPPLPTRYNCVNGVCEASDSGYYSSLQLCQFSGCVGPDGDPGLDLTSGSFLVTFTFNDMDIINSTSSTTSRILSGPMTGDFTVGAPYFAGTTFQFNYRVLRPDGFSNSGPYLFNAGDVNVSTINSKAGVQPEDTEEERETKQKTYIKSTMSIDFEPNS